MVSPPDLSKYTFPPDDCFSASAAKLRVVTTTATSAAAYLYFMFFLSTCYRDSAYRFKLCAANNQLTDGGPSLASGLPIGGAGSPFGAAPGSAGARDGAVNLKWFPSGAVTVIFRNPKSSFGPPEPTTPFSLNSRYQASTPGLTNWTTPP